MIQYSQTDWLILDRAGSEWNTDNGSTTAGENPRHFYLTKTGKR